MQIFLHQLDGSQTVVELNEQSTLESLIAMTSGSKLIYQGAILRSLECLGSDANVYANADLEGGKKKKKKKAYTTKKKNKHIHKSIKLLPLNLYSVDGKNALTQERATSPSRERPALHVDLELSWPSTGTDTTADSATPPSRWMLRLSRRTKRR